MQLKIAEQHYLCHYYHTVAARQLSQRILSFTLAPLLLIAICVSTSANVSAQDDSENVAASPRAPWGEFPEARDQQGYPWWSHALLWLPNRVMDLIDVFRVDAGVGVAYGGVVRLSKYAQVGYRSMDPVSIRAGVFGRRAPFIAEHSNEFGIGPGFVNSSDRKVCPGEVGVGVDAFVVGAYGGICVDELLDFVAGIFFIDVLNDDLN